MNDEDEKIKMTEKWLTTEIGKGNILAETYSALLKNALPEIKRYYYLQLSSVIDALNVTVRTIKENR